MDVHLIRFYRLAELVEGPPTRYGALLMLALFFWVVADIYRVARVRRMLTAVKGAGREKTPQGC